MVETLYTLCTLAVMPGWFLLAVAPRWSQTQRVTTVLLPCGLGLAYIVLFACNLPVLLDSGGFLHLSDVARVLQNPWCLLAGWIHYLAFDLIVGSWQVRDSARVGLPHLLVVPCLVLTCLLGPAGLVCYFALRWALARRHLAPEMEAGQNGPATAPPTLTIAP